MKYIIIFFLVSANLISFSQSKMIVDHGKDAYTSFGRFSTKIDSFSQLSSLIQCNTNGYLKKILGDMSDSLQFSNGQIVDLKSYFNKDSITHNSFRIIPKYDLTFKLSDKSLGIKRYNLEIELDQYGQLLRINWPKEKSKDKSKIINSDTIRQFVIEYAKSRRYDTSEYEVYFRYNPKFDKLCWLFLFPDDVVAISTYSKQKKPLKHWKLHGMN